MPRNPKNCDFQGIQTPSPSLYQHMSLHLLFNSVYARSGCPTEMVPMCSFLEIFAFSSERGTKIAFSVSFILLKYTHANTEGHPNSPALLKISMGMKIIIMIT